MEDWEPGEIQGSFPYYQIGQQHLNIGLTHYTITTNDGCNPPETCTFDVTVLQDLNAPVITCPANIVKPTDIDQETALVTFVLPTATDDNGTPLITQIAGPPSGTQFPKGETTISFLATDVSGNTASCSFTVLVYDDGIPTVVNTETPATLPQGSDTYNLPPALIDVEVPINGDVIGIQITEFPDGATSITIDGQEYGPPTESPNMAKGVASLGVSFAIVPFPVGGVFVPTTNLGVPTVSISVKPNIVNGESVTVVIPYVAVNSQQAQSPVTATITLNFEQPLIATISKIINITCFGANNGSVEITITGGNSPLFY